MIGIASPLFCATPFAKMAEAVAGHFEMWEVLSEGMHRLDLVKSEMVAARDTLDLELQAHAPLSDVNIGSVYDPMRFAAVNEVKRVISVCREVGIEVLTVHPGFVNGIAFLDRTKALQRTKESVRELASFAEDNGVIIAVENLPGNINATCTTAKELLEVIEGTSAGICFDLGHANTAGEVDNMLRHLPLFKNVHVHNNEGQWDQHNKIDDGTADLGAAVSALKASYSGNIVIESTDLHQGIESKAVLERLLNDRSAP